MLNYLEYILVLVAAIPVAFYYFSNHNRVVEKYYYKNNYPIFILLQISFFILMISIILNIRYILKPLYQKLFKSI